MKNVLIFGISDNPGGIETYVLNMLKVVDKTKIHFDILSVFDNVVYENEFNNYGCNIYKINSFSSNPFLHKKQLLEIIKNNNYDAIYMNLMDAGSYFTAKIAKDYGLKVITHSHNSDTNRRLLHKLLKNKLSNISDIRLACSNEAGKFMFGNSDFTIIPNAIEFNKYYYNENDRFNIRQKYNIGLNDIVFCHTGRMVEQKNPIFLIKLFEKLYENNKNIYLIYVGDGVLKDKIYHLVEEIDTTLVGFKEHIIFIGAVDKTEIPKYLSASDVFLFPSKYDGFGISLLEAVVNGLKCFSSKFVSREVDILSNIEYIDLYIDLWIDKISNLFKSKLNRNILFVDSLYDVDNKKYIDSINNIFVLL